MTDRTLETTHPARMYWLDNLRTFMVFLVVVLHAGLVYESSGLAASFWIVDDPSTNDLSGILNLVLDIFVMPAIFFISGFLAPSSLGRRKARAFLGSKFRRLIVPWLTAVLTVIPIYKVIFLYSRGLPQEAWSTYFHWSNGIWGQNWLWFLPVLFLFHVLYLLLSRLKIDISRITLKLAIATVFVVSFAYVVAIDLTGAQGWTKTVVIDFQNDRLLVYFMIFLVGALCYRLKLFESGRKGNTMYVLIGCTAWIPVNLYLALVIYPLISPGSHIISEIVDALLIRFTFLLSLLCLLYLSIGTFRRYLNSQGRISRELSENSYNVYITHTIVMGCIALALLDTAIPSLLKHLLLAVFTYCASSAMVYLYKRIGIHSVSIHGVQYDRA